MTKLTRVVCGVLLATVASTAAWAAPDDDLTGLTDREYVEYARDRFEWLAGEARASQRLASRFHRECRPDGRADSDAARACEVAKAADAQRERIAQEGRALASGLQQRLGTVPPWARSADAQLEAATHAKVSHAE